MAESQPSGRPLWWHRAWRWLTGLGRVPWWLPLAVLGLIILLAYSMAAITVLPEWVLSWSPTQDKDRVKAITDTRGALLGVLTTVVVGIGAIAAFLNYRETQRQNRETLDLARRGQLTDRFTKAIEQLGQTAEDKLDIRLGGIYSLEQIAKESKELHAPVMEILTAFLREHTRQSHEKSAGHTTSNVSATPQEDAEVTERAEAGPRADFQAIVTVLGRREVGHDALGLELDLGGVALSQADFFRAQLHGANFLRARLHGANFFRAQLHGAYFSHAQLQGANFVGARLHDANFGFAQLQDANFSHAQLQGANFMGARLQDANFSHAQLQGAYFMGAQLQGADFSDADIDQAQLAIPGDVSLDARGLIRTQLARAKNVDKAVLPAYLTNEPNREAAAPATD